MPIQPLRPGLHGSCQLVMKHTNKQLKNVSLFKCFTHLFCSYIKLSFLVRRSLHKAFLPGKEISDPLGQPLNSTDLTFRFPMKTNKPYQKHQNQPFQTSLICTQRLNPATAIDAYIMTTDNFKLVNKMILPSPTIHENSNCCIFYEPT